MGHSYGTIFAKAAHSWPGLAPQKSTTGAAAFVAASQHSPWRTVPFTNRPTTQPTSRAQLASHAARLGCRLLVPAMSTLPGSS